MCDQSRPSTSALSRGAVGSLAAPARFRNRRDGQRTSELLASSATDMGEVLRALSERTFSWLHQLRRLRIRWERDPNLHLAFLKPRMRPHLPPPPQGALRKPWSRRAANYDACRVKAP